MRPSTRATNRSVAGEATMAASSRSVSGGADDDSCGSNSCIAVEISGVTAETISIDGAATAGDDSGA
jgi:hypothetical protein